MPSPFPGMDPYLENPRGWRNFHSRILHEISDVLVPPLSPNYGVLVEEQVYVAVPELSGGNGSRRMIEPDVQVVETDWTGVRSGGAAAILARPVHVKLPLPRIVRFPYLEIRDLRSGAQVVTVIELLSPTNKMPGPGRDKYIQKRDELFASSTHLIEIDLLRAGPRMQVFGAPKSYDYSILVSRQETRAIGDLYPFTVRDRFPVFPVPLSEGDPEEPLDLNLVLTTAYERGRLDLFTNYNEPPEPPLAPEAAGWAKTLLDAHNNR